MALDTAEKRALSLRFAVSALPSYTDGTSGVDDFERGAQLGLYDALGVFSVLVSPRNSRIANRRATSRKAVWL